jgi:hypothetical protein
MRKLGILVVMVFSMAIVGCAGNMALVKGQTDVNTCNASPSALDLDFVFPKNLQVVS